MKKYRKMSKSTENVSRHWRVKYENFHFDVLGSTLSLSQKSTEELCIIKLKIDANFEEWMTC